MKEKIKQLLVDAGSKSGLTSDLVFDVGYSSDPKFGDYASNIPLVGSKLLKIKPADLAKKIIENLDQTIFETVEVAGPGFINFTLKNEVLIQAIEKPPKPEINKKEKILLEYFQPNIAKPLHMGHLRTAIIGDVLKRMFLYLGYKVESDTHMGDWGTQFGYLILAYKKYGEVNDKLYAQLNSEAENDKSIHEQAKQEFVKLEKHDTENRKIWQNLVDESKKQFLQINETLDILPFDHHWPESFYEDKMPVVLQELKKKKLLVESQGAQIVNLSAVGGEDTKNLGIAVIIKSDGGTTYLLRDLATFIFGKKQGFAKHLYVVDNRQSHHYKQLFAILKTLVEIKEGEGVHIDYGFISFKGEVLSTRKGNMVLAEDVLAEANKRVAKIIAEKNPDLKNKEKVIHAVSVGALKYFDLSRNRHSDIEFDWDKVLDFEGDSGPYLQYAYARLSSILRKAGLDGKFTDVAISATEREVLFKSSILAEVVQESLKDYLPNILANYLFNFATLLNKFYHESPVTQEKDEKVKDFRLALISSAKNVLGQGLKLLGIEPLDEM